MTPKEFVKIWFEVVDTRKYDQMKTMMADNHQFINPVSPVPLNRDAHIGMVQQLISGFTGRHTIEQMIVEGEWAVSRQRWSGKHTGEFNGIPASGKPVEFTITDIMHVVNGKLEEEYMEWNVMTLMMQIGAIPQPA